MMDLNWNSRTLTQGWQRGINAFFWGLGFTADDFTKAQVGIATPLLEGNLCNVHAHELAQHLKHGCAAAGLIGFPFGVSSVSDNLTQGHAAPDLPDLPETQGEYSLIAPLTAPFKPYADLQVCFGNLAPDGILFKVSSLAEPRFRGLAICFENAKAVADAAAAGHILPGHVVIIRGRGPVAAGMPEVLVASAALSVPALYGKVALLSDARISGVSSGAVGVHCSPEAAAGGPIGSLIDGDVITFDLLAGTIEVHRDIAARTVAMPLPKYAYGYLADFAATVTQAHDGCVPRWVCTRPATRARR